MKTAEHYKDTISYQYAKDVADGNIIAGKYIIKECKRFLHDLEYQENDDFKWYFDIDVYNFLILFQSLFCFADGIKAGQSLELAQFQIWIISNLFCWKHKEKGYIRFSKSYIQVSRKQGKSFLLGFIVIIKSLLEKYGQFYVVATKRDQSAITVKECKKLLDLADESVQKRFKIYGKANINKIVCDLTHSEIAPLSSDANTLDGLGVDLAVIDEFGAHPDYSLYEVMRSSQTYKLNAQIVIITTAYPNTTTSPAYTERCILIDSYKGITPMDDRYFAAIYELDEEDDYEDQSVWGKSNPLFVQFPEIMEKLVSDYESAKRDEEKLQLFLTKNLNIWINSDVTKKYLDFDEWKKCQTDKIDLEGEEVIVGVDMSKSTDLCGVSIISKDRNTGIIKVKSKAFLPVEMIHTAEMRDKMPYTAYANQHPEWLETTRGKFVDQINIEDYIRSIEKKYKCKIKAIAFDSWNAMHLMSSLANDYDVVDVTMSYKNFSPPIKRFRELVYEHDVVHEYNPILNFCAGNAITKSDTNENILLDKVKCANRIDLLVSAIIAYSEILNEEINDDEGNYYIV